ncbi:MAG TPA: TIGR03905 family TSCPD domain-containing protein, partial [Ruminococcus sp.]|nr:TIGR03905 family TSCPD domain-containing protein [Ruminococcus sp.]
MKFVYIPKGVCSRQITVDVDDNGIVRDVQFIGGCNGNLKALGAMCEGADANEVIRRLSGITC